jgi:hypothetical protein
VSRVRLKGLAILSLGAILSALAPRSLLAADADKQPPAELRSLERQVSLKLAHLRDEGPTDAGQRSQLNEAQQLDLRAEQEIAAGAYDRAEESLTKANAILTRLGI